MKTVIIILGFIFLSGIEVTITAYDKVQDKDNKDKFDKMQAQIDSLKESTYTFYFYEPLAAKDTVIDGVIAKNKKVVYFKPTK